MMDELGTGLMNDTELQEDNEDMTCTICLEPFEVGQDLSFSRDLKCHHCFHSDCLIPWLHKSDECPICRTVLIEDDGQDDLDKVIDDCDYDSDVEESVPRGNFRIVNGLISLVRSRGSPYSPMRNDRRRSDSESDESSRSSLEDDEEVNQNHSLDLELVPIKVSNADIEASIRVEPPEMLNKGIHSNGPKKKKKGNTYNAVPQSVYNAEKNEDEHNNFEANIV